jgi:hypothetical protein
MKNGNPEEPLLGSLTDSRLAKYIQALDGAFDILYR